MGKLSETTDTPKSSMFRKRGETNHTDAGCACGRRETNVLVQELKLRN